MNVLIIKHFAFDDERVIAEWSRNRGFAWRVVHPANGDRLPNISEFDLLVAMGGPMSAYEDERYPWLADEKRLLRDAVAAQKRVLGICLGGQLLAEALGGNVFRSEYKELGFHPLRRTESAHPLFAGVPAQFHSYQWHGDAFTLPEGAERLASSDACPNQAFAFGPRALGLQFHLETTQTCAETMLDQWKDELIDAAYIQSEADIRGQWARTHDSHIYLRQLLDNLVRS